MPSLKLGSAGSSPSGCCSGGGPPAAPARSGRSPAASAPWSPALPVALQRPLLEVQPLLSRRQEALGWGLWQCTCDSVTTSDLLGDRIATPRGMPRVFCSIAGVWLVRTPHIACGALPPLKHPQKMAGPGTTGREMKTEKPDWSRADCTTLQLQRGGSGSSKARPSPQRLGCWSPQFSPELGACLECRSRRGTTVERQLGP